MFRISGDPASASAPGHESMTNRVTDRGRRAAALVLGVYATIVAVPALVPRPLEAGLTPWIRGMLGQMHRAGLPGLFSYDVVEYASHFTLFLPLGILLAVTLGRTLTWLTVLAGLGFGALVELCQTMFALNHSVSWIDLLLNVLGVIVGVAVGWWATAPRGAAATLE